MTRFVSSSSIGCWRALAIGPVNTPERLSRGGRGRREGRCAGFEPALGLLLGTTLGLGLVRAARLFLALAFGRCGALFPFTRFARFARLRLGQRETALFILAFARAGQRAIARLALLFGQ